MKENITGIFPSHLKFAKWNNSLHFPSEIVLLFNRSQEMRIWYSLYMFTLDFTISSAFTGQ